MSPESEHRTLGIVKQVLRSKWFWGLGVLSVLILLTVIALPVMNNYRVIQRIGALGGSFSIKEPDINTVPFYSRFRFNIWGNNTFIKFDSVWVLNLHNTSIGDSDLIWLSDFKNLESLKLSKTQVSDAGLDHLKCFSKLEFLFLNDTQVGNPGLIHLKGHKHLERLWLNQTKVTDSGLLHLRDLTSLKRLSLRGTKVTDSGLINLNDLTDLEYLDLSNTQVTQAGVDQLNAVLPNCVIITAP